MRPVELTWPWSNNKASGYQKFSEVTAKTIKYTENATKYMELTHKQRNRDTEQTNVSG